MSPQGSYSINIPQMKPIYYPLYRKCDGRDNIELYKQENLVVFYENKYQTILQLNVTIFNCNTCKRRCRQNHLSHIE